MIDLGTLRVMENQGGKDVIIGTLLNEKDNYLHEIKNVVILKQVDFIAVINKDTKVIKDFKTEQEALDFVLDFYEWLSGEQTELF